MSPVLANPVPSVNGPKLSTRFCTVGINLFDPIPRYLVVL